VSQQEEFGAVISKKQQLIRDNLPCADLHLMSVAESVTYSENTCCLSVLEPPCYAFSIEQTGPNNCHTSCQSKRLANEHDVSCHLQYAEVSSMTCTQCAAPFANVTFQTHVQCILHCACCMLCCSQHLLAAMRHRLHACTIGCIYCESEVSCAAYLCP